MKIIYCINNLKNSGGTERIVTEKANYLVEKFGYDISVITTDQNHEKNFFKLNEKIKNIDLCINYFENQKHPFLKRVISQIIKKQIHKQRLKKILLEEKADIVISLGHEEFYFLYKITDVSKKIREYHFQKNYRILSVLENKKTILYKIKAYFETYLEEKLKEKYKKTIILTNEDLSQWKNKEKLLVIPNFTLFKKGKMSSCEEKRIIAVGRLNTEKRFDVLIEVWKEISLKYPEWKLEIYGDGAEKRNLQNIINSYKLKDSFLLKGATTNIGEKYIKSSICVMTSRYEGLPLVLLEAMNYGVPIISFACPCGPKDIIEDEISGILVENGNLKQLEEKIELLIMDATLRKRIGKEGRKVLENYSVDKVMNKWNMLFKELLI